MNQFKDQFDALGINPEKIAKGEVNFNFDISDLSKMFNAGTSMEDLLKNLGMDIRVDAAPVEIDPSALENNDDETMKLPAEDVYLDINGDGLSVGASNIEAGAANITDLDASTSFMDGDVAANLSADQIRVLSGSVGEVSANTDIITGNVNIQDAEVSLFDIDNAEAGLDIGGTTVVGVSGSIDAGASVKEADAEWDLSEGSASASVDDLKVGAGWEDATVTIAGTEFELPDLSAELNVDASAGIDISELAVNAEASLELSLIHI